MTSRVTTTVRIAVISAALAFVTNAALIGYVRYTTQTSALADMRQRVSEEAQTLREAILPVAADQRGHTVRQEIAGADPDFLVGLFGTNGHQTVGNVPTGLPRCIRVLVHWNTHKGQQEIQHVYLREAQSLRPDQTLVLSPQDRQELTAWIEEQLAIWRTSN